jgi:hypothetical protein
MSNRFAAFGSVHNNMDINMAWESTRNLKKSAEESPSCYELNPH